MLDKDEIRRRRNGAVMAHLNIEPSDRIFEMVPRQGGIHMVTLEKIIKVSLPSELDPEIEFSNAPISQTLIANVGSRNPIVARTILQSKDFASFHQQNCRDQIQHIAWTVMESLLAFDRTIDSISQSIDKTKKIIESDFEKYVVGDSPSHPPIAEGVEADFRSAVLLSHNALDYISELFPLILAAECKRGRYDQIITWSNKTFGTNDILSLMLQEDHRWIHLWDEVRNAFEHPRPNYYVQVNNFRLLASREIQLPTWQMKHPTLDVFRPQNMVTSLHLHQSNILTFFENLLLLLTDKVIPFSLGYLDQEEEQRDPDCPKRYVLGVMDRNMQS